MADALLYAYGIAVADHIDTAALTDGIEGAPVSVVAADGIAALVSPVDPKRFSEQALPRQFEDLVWLESIARAHHGVVATASQQTLVLPLPLATLFQGDAGVQAMLAANAEAFDARLAALAGCREWGVKAYVHAAAATADAAPQAGARGAGTAYLARRRDQRQRDADRSQAARDAAARVDDRLQAVCRAAKAHPPQDARLSGRREPMVLNHAYLVAETARAAFLTAFEAEQYAHDELELVLTGPWAPYSFADPAGS